MGWGVGGCVLWHHLTSSLRPGKGVTGPQPTLQGDSACRRVSTRTWGRSPPAPWDRGSRSRDVV